MVHRGRLRPCRNDRRADWPAARPITLVVTFPPGPALDLVARLVAGHLGDMLGQTIVVENRTGANGSDPSG
jgi:tripartite-type tricarboxylate transporter receptor subunit TctC